MRLENTQVIKANIRKKIGDKKGYIICSQQTTTRPQLLQTTTNNLKEPYEHENKQYEFIKSKAKGYF